MKFEEALKLMREGKKMTTKEFNKYIYFYIDSGLFCRHENGKDIRGFYLPSTVILSNTWYEYKEPILDDTEKKYLEAVLRPFKGRVKYVRRCTSSYDAKKEYLYFSVNGDEPNFNLPCFTAWSMYKGMELGRAYTLNELGLFEEEKE